MVKDKKEITNRSNKTTFSTQLSNNNYPKALIKASFLSLVTNAIIDILNSKLVAKSEVTKFKAKKFDNDKDNLIAAFFITKAGKQ